MGVWVLNWQLVLVLRLVLELELDEQLKGHQQRTHAECEKRNRKQRQHCAKWS